jgi:hypothetical protein
MKILSYNKSVLEELEKLYHDDNLKELSRLTSNKNLFKVLNIHKDELVHSDLIANLLRGDDFSSLGNEFLKKFLIHISKNAGLDESQIFEAMENYYEIKREHYHIDIFVNFPRNKWVIIIENKVEHTERLNQIKDYQNFVESRFSDYLKKVFIFLTKDGRASDTFESSFRDHINISLSYSDIGMVISQITPNLNSRIEKIICEEFMEHIKSDFSIVIEQLCSKLYKEYPLAIDFLLKNSIPYLERFEEVFRDVTEKYKLKSAWSYPTKTYGKTQYAYSKGEWTSKIEIIFFISQNPNSLYWLYIVPATDRKTKELLDPELKAKYYPVPECVENWSFYSIETKAIPITETPLKDLNSGVLSNKVELALKSAMAIANEYIRIV